MSLEFVKDYTDKLGCKIVELGHALDAYEAVLYKSLYYHRVMATDKNLHEKLNMISDVLRHYNYKNSNSKLDLHQNTQR